MNPFDQEADALSSLEDRIQRAIETVNHLRAEKEAALAEAADARAEAARAHAEIARLTEDNRLLHTDRKAVRSRIEKLLGQIDQLGA
jgi:FtsZ-binding cell division protein ZapB